MTRIRFAPLALAALAAVLLAGCGSAATGTPPAAEAAMPGAVTADAKGAPMADAMGGGISAGRDIVRTAWLSVRIDGGSVDDAAARLRALATQAGGMITDESTGDDARMMGMPEPGAFATLTAKVPVAQLDGFIAKARALGTVLSSGANATDVTLQVNDLEARIAALTASTARLRELLADATTVADVVAVESELGTRQAELDGLLAQQRALRDQVDMATVTATLVPAVADAGAGAPGFLAGLASGWQALVSAASGATTALGFVLPFAAIALAVAGAIAVPAVRRRRRVAEERPGDPSGDRAGAGRDGDARGGADRASG